MSLYPSYKFPPFISMVFIIFSLGCMTRVYELGQIFSINWIIYLSTTYLYDKRQSQEEIHPCEDILLLT